MQVHVLYFGVLKELLKRDGERMELPLEASVGTLLGAVRGEEPKSAAVWGSIAVAVNREYADAGHVLHEGDEVALLPPVSGGATETRLDWTETRLDWVERGEAVYVLPIARGASAMAAALGRDRYNSRSFDFAAHDKAVGSFAQDDTSLCAVEVSGRGRSFDFAQHDASFSIGGRRADAD